MVVLASGLDKGLTKTGTLFSAETELDAVDVFRPVNYQGVESVIKIALEPLNASELPQMLESIGKAVKAYPLLKSRIEDSGDHLLLGTGELYMDQVLYEVRNVFARGLELRLSEPFVKIAETVCDTSTVKA